MAVRFILPGRTLRASACAGFREAYTDARSVWKQMMTGISRTSLGLDPRRRRALFRAWHRGTREMDLILGPFADAHIEDLDEHDLGDFEALMETPDDELYTWIVGRIPAAEQSQTRVFNLIIAFNAKPERCSGRGQS
jgi:antitoxin CptB